VNAYGVPSVVDWGSDVFAMDGRISAAAPLALANQLPLLMIVKHSWSGFVPVRCAI